jgi:hypothetical protein
MAGSILEKDRGLNQRKKDLLVNTLNCRGPLVNFDKTQGFFCKKALV